MEEAMDDAVKEPPAAEDAPESSAPELLDEAVADEAAARTCWTCESCGTIASD